MKNKIVPSLWFNNEAAEAMAFYTSIFPDSKITDESPIVVAAKLANVHFIAINGGETEFKPNPSISFMFVCESRGEIDAIWEKLAAEGNVYMKLDSYPWSDYYGWIGDKYGYTWQLYLGKLADVNHQQIVPTLMFSHSQQGKCSQAINFYQSIFPDFNSHGMMRYEDGPHRGQIMHSQFVLGGFVMAAMDSGIKQDFSFNESVSLSLMCKDQDEIDHYWNAFTTLGEAGECGWCKDPFGVSWQVVPEHLKSILTNSLHAKQAFEALMKMKKIVIKDLENA